MHPFGATAPRLRSAALASLFALAALAPDTRAQTPAPAPASPPAPSTPPASQQAPTTAPAPTPAPRSAERGTGGEEDTIELSPFLVDGTGDVGYQAANTLAGSRLNASLKDTPAVLDVFTKEFLTDIAATNLQEAMAFSTSFELDQGDVGPGMIINTVYPGGGGVSYRTRGMGGSVTRDFIESSMGTDMFSVERVDQSSGPNSILYGIGNTGGIANLSSKRARVTRATTDAELLTDSNGTVRGTLDVNRVLVPQRLALRVNALRKRQQSFREYLRDNDDAVHLALTWKATRDTEVRLEFERGEGSGTVAYPYSGYDRISYWLGAGSPVLGGTTANAGLGIERSGDNGYVVVQDANPYVYNARNELRSMGPNTLVRSEALLPASANISGPGGRKTSERTLHRVTVERRLFPSVYMEATYLRQQTAYTSNHMASGVALRGDAGALLPNPTEYALVGQPGERLTSVPNPHAGESFLQGNWYRRFNDADRQIVQVTLAGEKNLGKWGTHRLVGTIQSMHRITTNQAEREVWEKAPFNNTSSNSLNYVNRRRYVRLGDARDLYAGDWGALPAVEYHHPTRGIVRSAWVPEVSGGNVYSVGTDLTSMMIGAQSHFFNRRLVLTTGIRRDRNTNLEYGTKQVFPPGWEHSTGYVAIDWDDPTQVRSEGRTNTYGAVLHTTDWLSAYANASTSLGVPRGAVVIGPDGLRPPMPKGEGLDAGLKFELLNNRVFLNLGYFRSQQLDGADRFDVQTTGATTILTNYNAIFQILGNPRGASPLYKSQADLAAYPMLRPTWIPTGDLFDMESTGYEARLTANLWDGLRLRAGYSNTTRDRVNLMKYVTPIKEQLVQYLKDLQARNPGVDVYGLNSTANTQPLGNYLEALLDRYQETYDLNELNFGTSAQRYNFFASYNFNKGWLKGVSTGVGMNHSTGVIAGYYFVRDPVTGYITSSQPMRGNALTDWNGMLRYATRVSWLGRNTRVSVQLNVRNLLDQQDRHVRRVRNINVGPGDPLPPPEVTIWFFQTPRSWTLTTRFEF